MSLDIILIKEIEHSDLGLISSRSVQSVLRHLDLGIIVKIDAASNDFADILIHKIALALIKVTVCAMDIVLLDLHVALGESSRLASANNICVSEVLTCSHILDQEVL